jgi:hypothetical protein
MIKIKRILLLFLLSAALFAQTPVRIASYNLHEYPNGQNQYFKKVMDIINPDALIVVEMDTPAGVSEFLTNCLSAEYTSAVAAEIQDYTGQNPNDCALYYKTAVFTLIASKPVTAKPRLLSEFKLVHKITNDTLIVFGVHLKAFNDTGDQSSRTSAAGVLRAESAWFGPTINYLVCGDFNIFTSEEAAFKKLLTTTNNGYFIDPMNGTGSFSGNEALKNLCTWSTGNGGRNSLNTRFDMFLVSPALMTPGGADYKEFKIYGNDDGKHYNSNMTIMPNDWFNDSSIGTALYNASDHLPVYVNLNFGSPVAVENEKELPKQYELSQNYPNPFNPSTEISYTIPSSGMVNIKVFDLTGREITTLVNEVKSAGTYKVKFDAGNLPSGIYLYSMQSAGVMKMKKMILLK